MSVASLSRASYKHRKEQRRARQLEQLNAILSQPPAGQLGALMVTWPQKLPKVVRRQLDPALRRARDELFEERRFRRLQALGWGYGAFEVETFEQRLKRAGKEAAQDHALAIEEILTVVRTLQGPKRLTIFIRFPSRPDDGMPVDHDGMILLSARHEMDALGHCLTPSGTQEGDEGLRLALGLGLAGSGGLIVRQQLALKVQRESRLGERVWANQEKLYGAYLLQGSWSPSSATQVRDSDSTDAHTGKPLPKVPGTSYGDLRDVAKRAGSDSFVWMRR